MIFEKDKGGYDAGVAIDDVSFDGCDLPRPEESCPDYKPFHCANKVSKIGYGYIGNIEIEGKRSKDVSLENYLDVWQHSAFSDSVLCINSSP